MTIFEHADLGGAVMPMTNKTVLITAAAQGMGRASAIKCAEAGASVIATDINTEGLADLAAAYPMIQTQYLDVCDPAAILDLAAKTEPLDGLFNCAGIVHHGSILALSDEDWARSFDINVTSMLRMSRAFLPGMIEQAARTGSTTILNMASMASSIKGFPDRAAYGATKAAVIGLTKSIAADFVKQGLRCNALCPGTVDTPSLRGRIAAAADPVQAAKDFVARQPMGRLATVDDLTPMIVYLLSDASKFVTGQAFSVDGGVTI
jgi:2-keto-3-deoxy-L-fuconate dehydrogenase